MNHAAPGTAEGRIPVVPANGIPSVAPPFDPAAQPIWEIFDKLLAEMPAAELNKLPSDAAEKHDRYIGRQSKPTP